MSEEPAKYLSKDYENYSLHWCDEIYAWGRPLVVGDVGAAGAFMITGSLARETDGLCYILELFPRGFGDYYHMRIPPKDLIGLELPEKLDYVHNLIENRDREMTWMSYGLWKSTKELFPHKDFGADRK